MDAQPGPYARLKIAVTGGSGRVGAPLVRYLVERGHSVVNIDKKQSRDPVAKFVYADLRDRFQVQHAFEGMDAVCHLGEIPHQPSHMTAEEMYSHNTRAGATVMQAAADAGVSRIIYTSTCQVYGFWGEPIAPPVRLPMDETHPLQPQNIYALAKAANEGFARLLAAERNIPVAIFRFPAVSNVKLEDLGEQQLAWIRQGGGWGDGCYTYVHTSDAARAFELALLNPRPGCEAYHFSAREVFCTANIRQKLIEKFPSFPALPENWAPHDSPVICTKAREHFQWKPSWNFLDQFREKFGSAAS
ncbi:MAG TPA: NAD(P)-dependent oxidoreductase [Planctomycetota bacterium]|nr:NAD(P)-dependent oxidoreductase [Planctomycetota bacterium]